MDVLRLSVPNEYLKAVFSLYSRYTISVQLIRYETLPITPSLQVYFHLSVIGFMACKNCNLEFWYLLPDLGWTFESLLIQLSVTAGLSIIVIVLLFFLAHPHQRCFSLKSLNIYEHVTDVRSISCRCRLNPDTTGGV